MKSTLVRYNKYLIKKKGKKEKTKLALQGVVVHTINPSTSEAAAGGSLKTSQVYIVRPCHCPISPISSSKYSIPLRFTMCSSDWRIIVKASLVRQEHC